jgi:hypothetical protein
VSPTSSRCLIASFFENIATPNDFCGFSVTKGDIVAVLMSALPPKADIVEHDRHVRFVPKADIGSNSTNLRPLPRGGGKRRVGISLGGVRTPKSKSVCNGLGNRPFAG